MIILSFGRWRLASGHWFIRERIYLYDISKLFYWILEKLITKNIYFTGWTPFVKIRGRRGTKRISV